MTCSIIEHTSRVQNGPPMGVGITPLNDQKGESVPPGYCGFIGVSEDRMACVLFFSWNTSKHEYLGASQGPSLDAIANEILEAIPGAYIRFLVPHTLPLRFKDCEAILCPKSHPVMVMAARMAEASKEEFKKMRDNTKSIDAVLRLL